MYQLVRYRIVPHTLQNHLFSYLGKLGLIERVITLDTRFLEVIGRSLLFGEGKRTVFAVARLAVGARLVVAGRVVEL